MGMIFKRGKIYWIKYYRNGKPLRVSAKSTKEADAKRLLKIKEGEVAAGRFIELDRADKTTFEELAADFLEDYRFNGKKSLRAAERSVKYLAIVFGGMKAVDITTEVIKTYIKKRQKDKLENGSINIELAALKRMFSLGEQCTPPKVTWKPHIPKLKENPPRKGFFEHEDFLKMREALSDYLRPVFTTAYYTAWRKEEVLDLKWDRVDLIRRKIVLDAGTTKNGEARVIPLIDEVYDTIAKQKEIRDRDYPECPYVFFREGKRITNFDIAYRAALFKCGFKPRYKCRDCKKHTEFPKEPTKEERICSYCGKDNLRRDGRVFHDTRRSGVRGMIRAGNSESVSMTMSGHKTRSVFNRYNITNEADKERAAQMLNEYYKKEEAKIRRKKGHSADNN